MKTLAIILLIMYIISVITMLILPRIPMEEFVDAYSKWKNNKHPANINSELELSDVYVLVQCDDIIGSEDVFHSEEYLDASKNYEIVILYNCWTDAVTIITTDNKQSVFIGNGLVHQLIGALASIKG